MVEFQVGPYVYQEFHHKTNLRWNWSNFTVTYQQKRVWQFDEDKSNGTLGDVIVTLNAPAVSINDITSKLGAALKFAFNLGMLAIKEKLFVSKTVDELLFKGYKDPILTDASKLPPGFLPPAPDKFGYFYPRNGSTWADGVFNMYTGEDDLHKLAKIARWNFSDHVPYFPGKCGEVRGAGDFFSPDQNTEKVEVFLNDLCRSIHLDYNGTGYSETTGIHGSVYKIGPSLFANQTVNPDNACFNPDGGEIPSGVFNVSRCRFGSPTFMSQPHFYQADPFYLTKIGGGLRPDESRHETAWWIDRASGLPFDVTARLQVNFHLKRVSGMEMFKNLQDEVFFPTVWFESRVTLEGFFKFEMTLLVNLKYICFCVGLVLMCVGVSSLLAFCIYEVVAATPFGRERGLCSCLKQNRETPDEANRNSANERLLSESTNNREEQEESNGTGNNSEPANRNP